MQRIANFEKVSFDQFMTDLEDSFGQYHFSINEMQKAYNDIEVPERATGGSAGYDFRLPVDIELEPGHSVKIPTGIRCRMNEGWVLIISPRSSLGFKYFLRIANIFPVIDSDYYRADNEGHIMIKIRNEGGKTMRLKAGDAFCQGIFLEYGITDFDNAQNERTGGFGSTDNREEEKV